MTRCILVVLLVVAASWDIWKRRIPNVLSAAVLLVGLVGALAFEGWKEALSGLVSAILTIVICWVPWMKGRIGGGDVKLAAAAAASVGMHLLHEYLLATALIGAVVGLVCYFLSTRAVRKEMAMNLKLAAAGVVPEPPIRGGGGRVSVPYGVACALAALLIVFVRKGW